MCQYTATNGLPNQWHLIHLASRAVGGAAVVFTEATAVEPDGRISPFDTGIYTESQVEEWKPIAEAIRANGAIPAIQLAHAGRKASTAAPWEGGGPVEPAEGGWRPIWSASDLPFKESWPVPVSMDEEAIQRIVRAFRESTRRAFRAGFEIVEIHAAHGYLIHQFLSPLSNERTDDYGISFENRTRLLREVVVAVREEWPVTLPLFVRISATDWVEGGWTLDDSVRLAKMVAPLGVDLIDSSSGGIVPDASIPLGPGYQVPFAERIRREAEIATGAVGLITGSAQAQTIVQSGQADLVLLAREMLRDPYWPRRAAKELGKTLAPPKQYGRAW
jgi:2,4-dienoyl-CoA reductase-like NADH-dependent reductase (Old Yellow Enzyme family)